MPAGHAGAEFLIGLNHRLVPEAFMSRVRTFLAVDVGDDIRAAATDLQQQLARSGAAVKWVTPESMHVTLLFLGDVDERELMTVCRAAATAVRNEEPFQLEVAGVGAFPTPRRPKVVWGGITAGAEELSRIQAALEGRLMDLGLYRKEDRGYTPHLTLGRVNREEDGHALAAELPKWADWHGGQTAVGEVLVMRSDLRRDGPEYTVMGRAPLGG
jgi:2'-5' RNA ligase